MSRPAWIAIAAVIAVVLTPLLIAPYGNDQATFFVAAQRLIRGALLYRDVLDLKPPLIYYLYAASLQLFGEVPVAPRLLDLLLQGATMLMLVQLVRRLTRDDVLAAAVALLYAIQYIAQNPAESGLTESYTGIVAIPILAIGLTSARPRQWFLAGVLGGVAFLLKSTLAVVVVVPVICELLLDETRRPQRALRWGMLAAGLIAVSALLPIYLVLSGTLGDYMAVQQFLSGYLALNYSGPSAIVSLVLTMLPATLIDYFTLTLTVAALAAAALAVRGHRVPSAPEELGRVQLMRGAAVTAALLLATVIVEAKLLPFHLARLYPFALILAADALVRLVRSQRGRVDRFARWVAPIAAVAMLAYSPLPRYAVHAMRAMVWQTQGAEGLDHVATAAAQAASYVDERELGRYVAQHSRNTDTFFAASTRPGFLYMAARAVPASPVLHAAFVKAEFAPTRWRDSLRAMLVERQPRFIAAQIADHDPGLEGTGRSSLELLEILPGVRELLATRYREVFRSQWYVLYERIE